MPKFIQAVESANLGYLKLFLFQVADEFLYVYFDSKRSRMVHGETRFMSLEDARSAVDSDARYYMGSYRRDGVPETALEWKTEAEP
jgi:hypothetical protein